MVKKVEHKEIDLIEGSKGIDILAIGEIIGETRKFLLVTVQPNIQSYTVAMMNEVADVMARGLYEHGDEYFKDSIRYFKEKMEAIEENREELEKAFKENDEKGNGEEELKKIAEKIRAGMGKQKDDMPEELRELMEYSEEVSPGMFGVNMNTVPEEKKEKIKKLLKKVGATQEGAQEEDPDQFRHYG